MEVRSLWFYQSKQSNRAAANHVRNFGWRMDISPPLIYQKLSSTWQYRVSIFGG
jgi:hypothetical protein